MTEVFKNKADAFLVKFTSPEHLKNWCLEYYGLDFPMGHIDPDSNSSPVEWMYEAYDNYRNNLGRKVPGYIVLSSRESYKTLTEAAFAVIMMAHFGCTIAHMAAIESQASKAVDYITTFTAKVKPYLEANGINLESANKRMISMQLADGSKAYVQVIIATMTGANSPHTNIFLVDEVDVMRFPTAYEEAKLIPGVFNGQFPITIKTSTRKFAFGMMEKEIQNADRSKEKLLRWNIMDITEKCEPERHRPEEPKVVRYIHNDLPLRNLSELELEAISPEKRLEFEKIEAYAGCASCELLPVCKMRLAHRPETDKGGLYKPIDFTILQFGKTSPDMAEAQLLCRKPSLSGLIYKRFDETEVTGNTLTVQQAWEKLVGEEPRGEITIKTLADQMVDRGIMFKTAIDWGFRHFFAMVVGCRMPNGDVWIVDAYAIAELELEDKLRYGHEVQSWYKRVRFYPDSEDPASIKTFKRNGLKCVQFKKDISAGIESVRRLIIDGSGRRRLKVVKHERTDVVIKMFRNHHFKLDPAGNPTREPDDEEYADVGDATRYLGQNIMDKNEAILIATGPLPGSLREAQLPPGSVGYHEAMQEKVQELTGQKGITHGRSMSGGLLWDFGGDSPPDEE